MVMCPAPLFTKKKLQSLFAKELPQSRSLTEEPLSQPPNPLPGVWGANTTPPPFGQFPTRLGAPALAPETKCCQRAISGSKGALCEHCSPTGLA